MRGGGGGAIKEVLERASAASTLEEKQKAFELQTEYTDEKGVFHPAAERIYQ